MPEWGIRTSLCAAPSRACGPICHRTHRRLKIMRNTTKNPIASIAVISLTAVLTASLAGAFTASPRQSAPQTPATDAQLATVQQYCVRCHHDRAKTGGFSFQGLTPERIGEHAELFEKAVRKLRGRVMPPP